MYCKIPIMTADLSFGSNKLLDISKKFFHIKSSLNINIFYEISHKVSSFSSVNCIFKLERDKKYIV